MNRDDFRSILVAEFIRALMLEAERQASLVGAFLKNLSAAPGFHWMAKPSVALSEEFLLGLGAALRLSQWEALGLATHLGSGLPSAKEAVLDVFRATVDEQAKARTARLMADVQILFFARFAWMASCELGADMLLGSCREEALVDALAEFAWNSRHAARSALT